MKEQLAEGAYRPDETLSVDGVATQIGVSRQTAQSYWIAATSTWAPPRARR